MAVLEVFKNATIAKTFLGYQEGNPFPGKVAKVDSTGSDDKPFKIHYDDGDKEWVTLTELTEILVDAALKEKARHFLYHGVPKEAPPPAKATANGSRKRTQAEAGPSAPTSAGAKKPRGATAAAAALAAPAAPAAAAAEPAVPSSAARRAGKVHQQPAAAEAGVGVSSGANPSRSSGRAAAAAAGPDSAAVSPSELAGLVKDVCQAADQHAARLQHDAAAPKVWRLVHKGPGAATLPKMAQATITDHEAVFTIYGSPRGGKIDYKVEADEVLTRLADQLDAAATKLPKGMNKQMLKRVRVHLRDTEAGVPGFKEAWDAWVDQTSLPVLTILQGGGPFTNAGIVLEADAYIGA